MNCAKRGRYIAKQCLAISCFVVLVCPPLPAEITRIIAFGDSMTDTGNWLAASDGAFPPPPNWEGRFSNGPVWIEYLADYIGVSRPAASLLGGTNAAVGGATTGDGLFFDTRGNSPSDIPTPRLGAQIEQFLASHTLSATDLVVVWAGFNDLDPSIPGGARPARQVVTNLIDHITTLHGAGATNFLIADLNNSNRNEEFNALWTAQFVGLRQRLAARIFFLPFGSLVGEILSSPQTFGLTGDFGPIINRTIPNPDEYAVWDEVGHLTTAAHRAVADRALAALSYLEGDYNGNGVVEQSDLNLVLSSWGARGRPLPEGWTRDLPGRFVDQDELNRVLLSWGLEPLVPPVQPMAGAATPEPSSAILLLAATMLVLFQAHQGTRKSL